METEPDLNKEVLNIFGYTTSAEPGPSSLMIATPVLIDPSVVEISPGLIERYLPNLEADKFSGTDDFAEELTSSIGNIDIDTMNTKEDIAPEKGKGVDRG